MINKHKNSFIIIIILAGIFVILFLPIKYPITIKSKGKILPVKTWILSKGFEGRLFTTLTDNASGVSTEYFVTEFERGDPIKFKLNNSLFKNNQVSKGDTVGQVVSTILENDLAVLKGDLEKSKALLKVQESSEKESIIAEEKRKLEFAEMELEEQTKIYNRKLKLVERDLISQQEFEADEARYELAKINIKIAQERLKSVLSGVKQEEINYTKAEIKAFENQIKVMEKKLEVNNILSPINGIISQSYSPDTLLVINDTSKHVIIIPVKWSDTPRLKLSQAVEITNRDAAETVVGEIVSIANSVITLGGNQYVLVTALTNTKLIDMRAGLNVDCKIESDPKTAIAIVSEFLRPMIN